MQLVHSPEFYLGYFIGGLCLEQVLDTYWERVCEPLKSDWFKTALRQVMQGHGWGHLKATGNPILFLMYLAEREAVARYSKQMKYLNQYFAELTGQMEDIQRLRHDIKNHYISLSSLLRQGNVDTASQYLEQLYSHVEYGREPIKTGNPVMDLLLCEKIWEAEGKGIHVEKGIHISRWINVAEFDWSILLGNALDNAIEANCFVETDRRKIYIQICSQGNIVHIHIRNPMRTDAGKDLDKKDTKNHGLGLQNMQRVVDKYHGVMQYKGENGVFVLTILLCDV